MTEPSSSRQYLKTVITIFLALIVVVVAIGVYRYWTPRPEADIEAAQAN